MQTIWCKQKRDALKAYHNLLMEMSIMYGELIVGKKIYCNAIFMEMDGFCGKRKLCIFEFDSIFI